ncbi:MAG: MotA/TolQ/ExbB proton channel family protein [Alphaproteobacteria bacterium]|nr:MotA/TolQ/ExbB proton channel family protein [Alphaproteobacteria bacterium]
MIETLVAGGPVMIPIGLCSLVAVAVFLERLWALRRGRVVPTAFCVELLELVKQGRFDDAQTLCRKRDVAAGRILEVALGAKDRDRAAIKERLEEVGRREAAELERFIPVLGTIASIAPLLGLLGTVLGMIITFQAIQSQGGMADVSALAGGISQALVTTFAGLCVGIPAVMANRFLLSRVDALLLDLEEVSLGVIDQLVEPAA